jgi:hypothetical protein
VLCAALQILESQRHSLFTTKSQYKEYFSNVTHTHKHTQTQTHTHTHTQTHRLLSIYKYTWCKGATMCASDAEDSGSKEDSLALARMLLANVSLLTSRPNEARIALPRGCEYARALSEGLLVLEDCEACDWDSDSLLCDVQSDSLLCAALRGLLEFWAAMRRLVVDDTGTRTTSKSPCPSSPVRTPPTDTLTTPACVVLFALPSVAFWPSLYRVYKFTRARVRARTHTYDS